MTYEEIKHHPEVLALLARGNHNLGVLGFTDHSTAHTALVAERAAYILRKLGYSENDQELARIAGFMHDIGNAINRAANIPLPDQGSADTMTTQFIPAPEIFLAGAITCLLILVCIPQLSRAVTKHTNATTQD